jgi:hypothetical protein
MTSTWGRAEAGALWWAGGAVGRGVRRAVGGVGVGVDVAVGDSVGATVDVEVVLGAGVGVALVARALGPPQAASNQPITSSVSSLPVLLARRLLSRRMAIGSTGLQTLRLAPSPDGRPEATDAE